MATVCCKTLIIRTKKSHAKLRKVTWYHGTVEIRSRPDSFEQNPSDSGFFQQRPLQGGSRPSARAADNITDSNEIYQRILYPSSSSSLSVFPPCCPVFLPCCRDRSRHSAIRQWSRLTVLALARRLRQPILSKKPLVQRFVGT